MNNSRLHVQFERAFRSRYFAPAFLLLLTLLVLGDVLFNTSGRVLSRAGTDTFLQFFHSRDFGFSQILQGNLPLWNPYLFSGTPYVGIMQSAVLYPVNWIHLLLPTDRAINLEIALHVYLTGLGMYFWTRNRRLHRGACLMAAVLWMFGAPYFLKITAGHLAPLAAMCWIPLLLLSIDLLFDQRFRDGCLLGIFAGAMQLLAGHPQTSYNTAIAILLYAGFQFVKSPQRVPVGASLLVVGLGAVVLAAAQLGAGFAVAQESARAGAVPHDFARTFAQPPENFITLFAPNFFTDARLHGYWGRAYLWEVSLFMSVTGLCLACYGVVSGFRTTARYWLPLVLLWFLAISAHTPLFNFIYSYVPGFDRFRGHSKFIVPAAAFLAMLAAIGFDRLLTHHQNRKFPMGLYKKVASVFGGLAGLFIGASAVLHLSNPALWPRVLSWMSATQESYTPRELFTDAPYIRQTAEYAGTSLLICGAICLLFAALLWNSHRSRKVVFAIGVLAIVEIVVFARANRPTFTLGELRSFTTTMSVDAAKGQERFLGTQSRNAAWGSRTHDLWGYDPVVLGRYIQFMAWSQGYDPSEPNAANVRFQIYHRLYAMLRCRYIHLVGQDGEPKIGQLPEALPHVLLLNEYSVLSNRDEIFKAMNRKAFNPRRQVLLESEPNPKPVAGDISGVARVFSTSTDSLIVEAETERPAILLITDSYSKDWKAWGLNGSSQQKYSVMPANYVLRAIPLQAGKHKIRLEYSPTAFHIGKWISLFALIAYGLLLFGFMKQCKNEILLTQNAEK